jgi:hypothetical protein
MHFGERHSQFLPFYEYVFASGKSPIKVKPKTLYILLRKVYILYADWGGGGQVPLCVVNVIWTDLDSLAFIFNFFNHFHIASRLVCSFCEAMPGPLSMANTAVLSANVAVLDSVEVGRSAVYSRYNSGRRALPWGTLTFK